MKVKSSNLPPRIDLEPLYTALKSSIGEKWATYKEAISLFVLGRLNQEELSSRIDPFITTASGETEHQHNQLLSAILSNLGRETPESPVASWVSATDKPSIGVGSKQVSGDALEQRLKTEVKLLPARDRKRLKALKDMEYNEVEAVANVPLENARRVKPFRTSVDTGPASTGGLGKTNLDIEIRKKWVAPLAVESGEFPDTATIESRMLPMCYETGLGSHGSDAAQFMTVATETYVKELLSDLLSKTRSNGPGLSGSAGSGGGAGWIQTHKYRVQLEREEEGSKKGEIQRDKSGLLPIEAKAASERGPLSMSDVRTALEIQTSQFAQFPVLVDQIMGGYRDGELDVWDEHQYIDDYARPVHKLDADGDVQMGGMNGIITNGTTVKASSSRHQTQDEPTETEDYGWVGGSAHDKKTLNSLFADCLAVT